MDVHLTNDDMLMMAKVQECMEAIAVHLEISILEVDELFYQAVYEKKEKARNFISNCRDGKLIMELELKMYESLKKNNPQL